MYVLSTSPGLGEAHGAEAHCQVWRFVWGKKNAQDRGCVRMSRLAAGILISWSRTSWQLPAIVANQGP